MEVNPSSAPLLGVGIPMPIDFPRQDYEAIHRHCWPRIPPSQDWRWVQFILAWHAVAYRFAAMAEHDEGYRIAFPGTNLIDRYKQERELFGFFVTGLSTLEAYAYGTHLLLAIVYPEIFPTDNLRNIKPRNTRKCFEDSRMPSEPLIDTFATLVTDPQFNEWEAVRNVLAHRGTAGSSITLGKLNGDMLKINRDDIKDQFDMPSLNLTTAHRKWLSDTLSVLLKNTLTFIEKNIAKTHI